MNTTSKHISRREPNGKLKYLRVCPNCGDEKYVWDIPHENCLCKKCLQEKRKENRVKYFYFCPSCSSVRVLNKKRKTPHCQSCNVRKTKITKKYFFDFEIMKCRTLYVNPKPLPKPKKVVKKAKPKKKSLSKNADYIDPIALAKVREVNRKHREEVKKSKKAKIVHKKTDAELIAEFLKKNEPSVKLNNEPICDLYLNEVQISSSHMWA